MGTVKKLPVIVVDVDGAHHLLPLQVANSQGYLADGVAPRQLDDVRGRRELGVHLQGGELEGGVGDLGVVAHETGIALQVIPVEVDHLAEAVVDARVGVVREHRVLRAQHPDRLLDVGGEPRLVLDRAHREEAQHIDKLRRL